MVTAFAAGWRQRSAGLLRRLLGTGFGLVRPGASAAASLAVEANEQGRPRASSAASRWRATRSDRWHRPLWSVAQGPFLVNLAVLSVVLIVV
jgi:hypothetical protein